MKRLLRVFVFLLLAVLAAGTVAHAAATTEMSLRMAVVAAAGVGMDDCDGCDKTSDIVAPCDQSCIQPFAALPASESANMALVTASRGQSALQEIFGRLGPPERHPPQ